MDLQVDSFETLTQCYFVLKKKVCNMVNSKGKVQYMYLGNYVFCYLTEALPQLFTFLIDERPSGKC